MNRTLVVVLILLGGITLAYSYWLAGSRAPDVAPPAPASAVQSQEVTDVHAPSFDLEDAWLEHDLEEFFDLEADEAPDTAALERRVARTADDWATLLARAEAGDARAAFELFRMLDLCRRMQAQDGQGGRMRRIPPAMVQACDELPAEMQSSALDWLTQAADFGETAARLTWAMRARSYLDMDDEATRAWHDTQATRYLGEARDSGSIPAMQVIARQSMRADPVAAWSHVALAMRVMDERARDSTGSASVRRLNAAMNWQTRMQMQMDSLGGRLTLMQLAAAQQQADEMYERCCRR